MRLGSAQGFFFWGNKGDQCYVVEFLCRNIRRGGKMETKVVVGAEGYNNNPGWLHTNEDELNLLKRETIEKER